MATSAAIYQKYSDNVAKNATITIETGGAAPTGYEATNLVDDNPAKVAKISATTGAWLFDFGSAQRVDLIALIHHDFDAGADVKIQGNASNSWGTPSFEASLTIPTWIAAGTTRRWPVNPYLDLTGQSGYSASGFRYWRLVITSNSQNLELGQVWMSPTIRQFVRNHRWDYGVERQRLLTENQTAFGVSTAYTRLTDRYRQSFVINATNADATDLRAQWADVDGRTYPWLWVPDPTVNACYLVRWASDSIQETHTFVNYRTFELAVEEVARGLRPGS